MFDLFSDRPPLGVEVAGGGGFPTDPTPGSGSGSDPTMSIVAAPTPMTSSTPAAPGSKPTLQWAHADSRGMNVAIEAGIARAKAGALGASGGAAGGASGAVPISPVSFFLPAGSSAAQQEAAAADFRALLVSAGISSNWMRVGGHTNFSTGDKTPLTDVSPSDFDDVNRFAMAKTPLRAAEAIMQAYQHALPSLGTTVPASFVTLDGKAPIDDATTPAVAVGFGWPAAVAVIVGIGGLIYLGDKALEIYHADLTRKDAMSKAIAALAKGVELSKNHIDAEAAAGKSLPLNDAEVQTLKTINADVDSSAAVFAASAKPLPSIFPDTTKVLSDVTGAAKDTALGLGAIAAIGAVVLGLGFVVLGGGK